MEITGDVPIKILLLRTLAYPNNGPATRRMIPFVDALIQRGHQVTICAIQGDGPLTGRDNLTGASLELVPGIEFGRGTYVRIKSKLSRFIPTLDTHPIDVRSVAKKASRILSAERYDAIITTSPPLSSAWLGNKLRQKHGLPLIVDIRDLPDEFDSSRKSSIVRANAKILQKSIQDAIGATTVSDPLRDALRHRYRFPSSLATVTNGFDPSLVKFRQSSPTETFAIGYFGILYANRRIDLLLRAVSEIRRLNADCKNIEVNLFGPISKKMIDSTLLNNLESQLHFHGKVPYAEAIEAMHRSSLLINFASEGCEGILPTKIFEYAVTGRPMLSIPSDNGVIDKFISSAGVGRTADSVESIKETILHHLKEWKSTGITRQPNRNQGFIETFDRTILANEFSIFVERVLDEKQNQCLKLE